LRKICGQRILAACMCVRTQPMPMHTSQK
jgi:hypothetical protein